jgi:hypothetical protein
MLDGMVPLRPMLLKFLRKHNRAVKGQKEMLSARRWKTQTALHMRAHVSQRSQAANARRNGAAKTQEIEIPAQASERRGWDKGKYSCTTHGTHRYCSDVWLARVEGMVPVKELEAKPLRGCINFGSDHQSRIFKTGPWTHR